jgi:hypothetical protein
MLTDPVVFPLWPIIFDADGKATCGCIRPKCSDVGKHPAIKWRHLEFDGEDEVPKPSEGAGYGIKTGKASNIVVIDTDGVEAEAAWFEFVGEEEVQTHTVKSPRGKHRYYQHPGFPVRNSIGELAPHIDVRGDGGYVVGPGSPHRSSPEATYKVIVDVQPAPCPPKLVAWFKEHARVDEVQPHADDVTGPELARRTQLYIQWVQNEAPLRGPERRGRGDATLFDVVQKGAYDYRLPTETVLEVLEEHYDPRCDPPWGDELPERVAHKSNDAKTKSMRPRVEPPSDDFREFFLDPKPPASKSESESKAAEPPASKPESEPKSASKAKVNPFFAKVVEGGWDRSIPPPEYLVERFIERGKVIMLYAEPGALKTMLAIDLAVSVATGRPWLTQYGVRQSKVLYCDWEDGIRSFSRRTKMLSGGQSIPDLHYISTPGQLAKEEFWSHLSAFRDAKDYGLVILDTLSGGRAGSGVTENDESAAEALKWAGQFSGDDDRTAVLVLHHANKAGKVRGTSSFAADCDLMLNLTKLDAPDNAPESKLTTTKTNSEKTPALQLRFTTRDGITIVEREPEVEEPDGNKKLTAEEIRSRIKLHISAESISSVEKLRSLVGVKMPRLQTELKELLARGEVVKLPSGYADDDDAKRWRRVKAALKKDPNLPTLGQIAKAAYVTVVWLESIPVADKRLQRRVAGDDGEGWMIP